MGLIYPVRKRAVPGRRFRPTAACLCLSATRAGRHAWAEPGLGPDLESGEPFPIGPEGHVSASPLFSPDGLLAYRTSTLGAIVLVDPDGWPGATSPSDCLPERALASGTWSPDGPADLP
jgi:hypothetical protein